MTGYNKDSLIAQALAAGAHDFICKPLRSDEVLARFSARRNELHSRSELEQVKFGDLILDLHHRTLTGSKGHSFLSSMEVEILKYLMRANALVVKKDSIKRHAWGNITVSDSAFDRKLFEVRKAVRETSEKVELKAVYGKGVVMRLSSYEEDQILLVDKEVALSRDI